MSAAAMSTESPVLPPEALRHLHDDEMAWLVTVTASGMGYPTPVWFAFTGGQIIIYTEPDARKVANITRQPRVVVHFNSDPSGSDIVVIRGRAEVDPDVDPNTDPVYVEKYTRPMARLGMTPTLLRRSSTRLRITPRSVWLGDASAASEPA
jgi:PPOX class probable F420-dependent enzyme